MDSNRLYLIELICAVPMVLGLAFFLWIGLDLRDMTKHGRTRMRNKHFFHVLLGLWPFLTALLLVVLYGRVSAILGAFYFWLSGLLYLLVGLWDTWYECTGLEPQRVMEGPTALARMARGYPILGFFRRNGAQQCDEAE